jgi:hypothetical protein
MESDLRRECLDLSKNHDVIDETERKYIVGYICEAVGRRKQRVVGQFQQGRNS